MKRANRKHPMLHRTQLHKSEHTDGKPSSWLRGGQAEAAFADCRDPCALPVLRWCCPANLSTSVFACSQDSSVLSPLLHRLDRSPQHLRNPDESRACSCFLSSSADAASCRRFVAVDLASPLLCTAAAGFLVRCGISGAPSIRTGSDRPLRSWVFGF